MVLPLSAFAETSGTVTNHERRVQPLRRAVPPAAGKETWQILCELGARMGMRFKMKYADAGEVFEEIRRVVPMYRDVVLGGAEPDGIWDLDKSPLARQPFETGSLARSVAPQPTIDLDPIERRFKRWFDEATAEALARLAKGQQAAG